MHEHHMSHLRPTITDFGIYIVNAQSKNRHLTANVKDESNHDTVSGALSKSTDESKWHLPDVCNRVRMYILNRVEQMKTIRQ